MLAKLGHVPRSDSLSAATYAGAKGMRRSAAIYFAMAVNCASALPDPANPPELGAPVHSGVGPALELAHNAHVLVRESASG